MALLFGSLIFISSCTINIVQAPASSDAGKRPLPLPKVGTSSPSQTPKVPSEPDFLDDVSTEDDDELLCEPFEFPELDEVPQFPYVPPEKRADDEYVSALLIEHLDALTLFIEQTDSTIRAEYDKYLEECR
jgi:hypothetical protein